MSELPEGWADSFLGDVASFVMGQAPSGKDCNTDGVGTVFVKAGEFGSSEPIVREWTTAPLKFAKKGDVLICVVGATAGKINLAIDCAIGRSVAAIRPETEISQKYIYYFLAGQVERLRKGSTGSAQGVISKPDLAGINIPLPPLAEQTRIAANLDELLAQVDTLKARIDAIPALLKRFRQSVLAAAVSGRLTEEWRAQHVGWVDEGSPTTVRASSSLPLGWSSKTAGDICGFITKGTTPSKEKMTAGHGEVPYIKVYNLTFTGALDFSIDPTFVDSSTHSTDLKRSIVKPGDVLMNIVGPPLGKVSIVPATYPEWNINQAIARFRAGDEISAAYLALCLRTEVVLSHAVSRAKATAGQFNLTLEICRELPLPVPTEEEQTEIVRRVEQLFAFADQLEAKVASAKSRIDHLTQSILAKAFRGELVPQDPNDEPANVLLERIKAQRAAAPKSRRGRKASS